MKLNNKEKYKKAFSALHASDDSLYQEVIAMAKLQKRNKIKLASAAEDGCILIGGAGSAYATNLGGIQRTIQIWIHGDQTTANLEVSTDDTQSSYTLNYKDENGESREISGGGVAINADGSERPLTADELMQELISPDVEYLDDGTVWVYYKNQALEITDNFDDNNVCYTKIVDGDDTLYLTIKYQNGYSYSSEKYIEPSEFN